MLQETDMKCSRLMSNAYLQSNEKGEQNQRKLTNAHSYPFETLSEV